MSCTSKPTYAVLVCDDATAIEMSYYVSQHMLLGVYGQHNADVCAVSCDHLWMP